MKKLIDFLDFEYEYVDTFSFEKNGIQIIETINTIEIYNDVFRTIPLFITKMEDSILIFSNFINFYNLNEVDKTIDKTGLWEIILYGFAIGTRTLYKNIQQMPSASKIVINKETLTYSIERYWDFQVKEDSSIQNIDDAADGLFNLLKNTFSEIPTNLNYCTGISGGMDSRITLAFLSNSLTKQHLDLFTYGFNKKIYEYKYAKEISKKLNYEIPTFHKLDKFSYYDSISYLPYFTGGQISINHSPLFSYLNKSKLHTKNKILIATSYSEIIFSLKTEKKYTEETLSLQIKLNNSTHVPDEIKESIQNDLNMIKTEYNSNKSFSNINDYLYLTEQHPKFHEYLTYLFSSKIKIINPYTNFKLLTYVMSIPKELRFRKRLQDKILKDYFHLDDKNVSSSRFEWKEIGSNIEWIKFKVMNKANVILRILSKGSFQIMNPYQTEEQARLLHQFFLKDLEKTLSNFYKIDLIDMKTFEHYNHLPISSLDVIERYHILSLGEIINAR